MRHTRSLDGKVAFSSRNSDTFTRDGQGSYRLIKGCSLLRPKAAYKRITPISVQIEVGSTEVLGGGEPSVPNIDTVI